MVVCKTLKLVIVVACTGLEMETASAQRDATLMQKKPFKLFHAGCAGLN